MSVQTKPSLSITKEFNCHNDDGHVLDILHSAKHLYLCISWCARASHQELMVEKYIQNIEALKQPPIALQVLLDHCTIKELGDLEIINGAIPEPFVRTAEALLALLGRHETELAWRRPALPTARAAHAWKWMRRELFGNFRPFMENLQELTPDECPPDGTRVSRARVALSSACFNEMGWLQLRTSPGCLLIELFRRWALSIVRYADSRGLGDPLRERCVEYKKMRKKIETGIARGIGQGLLWKKEE